MISITIFDEDLDEGYVHEFPSKMEVCDDCHGHGYVLNESMRSHGYSSEEFFEEFDDEERLEYFKPGGIYDVACPTCQGKNVIEVIDESRLHPDEKRIYEIYLNQCQEQSEYEDNYRATKRDEKNAGC